MKSCEDLEEVAVDGRGIRNARVSKQKRKQRTERGPEHHRSKESRYTRTVNSLDKNRNNEVRLWMLVGWDKLTPRHHAYHREVYGDVDQRHGDHADDDRARNGASGFLNLVADVADVVIAEIIEDTDPCRRAQT